MKIFIACSKHFYHKIPRIKEELEKAMHKITLPNSYEEPLKEEELKKLGKEEHITWKSNMMKLQKQKVEANDALLVLNFKKGKYPNYIGGGTFMEVVKAWELKKKIYLHNPLPNCSFTDELTAINPIIINGDLTKMK